MTSRQSRWRHDNGQVRVNIDATLVAIFRIETKIIDHVINTISMREKYSFIAYHWIYGHSTLGYQNHVKPSASLRLYMIFIPRGWNGRIFNGSIWKSLIIIHWLTVPFLLCIYLRCWNKRTIYLEWYIVRWFAVPFLVCLYAVETRAPSIWNDISYAGLLCPSWRVYTYAVETRAPSNWNDISYTGLLCPSWCVYTYAVETRAPSIWNDISYTGLLCPSWCVYTYAVETRAPSIWNDISYTGLLCPSWWRISSWASRSHNLQELSKLQCNITNYQILRG